MDATFTFNDGQKDRTVDAFDLAIDEQIMLAGGGRALALASKQGDGQATKDFIAKLRELFKLEPWSKAADGTVTGTHSADVGRIYSEFKEFTDREKKEPESNVTSSSATDTPDVDLTIAPATLDSGSTKTEQTIARQSH